MTAISGNDGNISGNVVSARLNTWSATLSRAVSDVTKFGNIGRNRVLGLHDLTGSAGGLLDDAAAFTSLPITATASMITLTAQSGNTIAANVVVDQISLGSTKSGDATVSFNFQLAEDATSGTIPYTVTWS